MTINTPDDTTCIKQDYITSFQKIERIPFEHKLFGVAIWVLYRDKPIEVLFSKEAERDDWFNQLKYVLNVK